MARSAVVEIALRVGLQIQHELVPLQRQAGVVVEVLVEVRLAVAVEIVQPGDLITARRVDDAIDDLQAQRLLQSRGEALPADLVGR